MEGIPGPRMSLMDLKSIIENRKETEKMTDEFRARDMEFSQISTQDTISSKIIREKGTLSNVKDFNYTVMRKFPNFNLRNDNQKKDESVFSENRPTKKSKRGKWIYKEIETQTDNKRDGVGEEKDKENQTDSKEMKSLEKLEMELRIRACLSILKVESLYWLIKGFKEDDVYLALKDQEFVSREVLVGAIWELINLSEDFENVNV